MSEKLKIFSSKEWIYKDSNTIVLLWPFWSHKLQDSSDPDITRFDEYVKTGGTIFELVEDISSSEIAIYPQEIRNDTEFLLHVKSIAAEVKKHGKKLLVYYNSDDDSQIDIDNCILFRTSFYKSKQKKYEFAFPGWSVDFINYFPAKEFSVIRDVKVPSVSYCGYIDNKDKSLKAFVKLIIRPKPKTYEDIAKEIRGESCRRLRGNKNIKTNFVIRNGFWAEGIEDKAAARKDYATNMIDSLYVITTRGGGNFSYRIYEVLSCGRIPIFINTDAVLPYDTIIDWKKHVVWIEQSEIKIIAEKLLTFHNSRSDAELQQLQKDNRKLYEEYISPVGFHNKLKDFIRTNK